VVRDAHGRIVGLRGTVQDISERKQVEERLQESKARLNLALQSASMGAWHWDVLEDRRFFDEQACHLLGIDPTTFNGTADEFFGAVHPEDREMLKAALARTIEQDVPYEPEYRAVWPDGSVHYIAARGRLVRHAVSGKPERINGIIWDITDRKGAEEALRKSEANFRSVLENSRDAIYHLNVQTGRYEYISPSSEKITGFSPDELASQSIETAHAMIYSDDMPAMRAALARLEETGQTEAEYRQRTKSGDYRWISNHMSLTRDGAGRPLYRDGNIRDITESKRAEEALKESEKRFRSLYENSLDGVMITCIDGSVLAANEKMCDLVGMTEREMIGAARGGIAVHDSNLEAALEERRRTGHFRGELRYRRKDGSQVPVEISSCVFEDSDGRVLTGTVVRDITEQKRAEEAIRKAHDELELRVQERTTELQQAYDRLKEETAEREQIEGQLRQAQKMEALGTLSGGIAHDFNNILAAIIGFSELLEGHIAKESRDARHLHRIMEAGIRGRELVRQMLTFSRKAEQEKKPLAVSSIVKETVKLLRATTPSTISVRVNAVSESALILADPTQIQQVLMNLCTNAAYAMRENGGSLDIELSDHSVSPSNGDPHGIAPGRYVKLIVRDTGIGMSSDIMDKIFDPFFTTKKVGEGTGLGLSVVHGIVKQHDGHITAESEPGRGSVFTVYFPRITGGPEADDVSDDELPTGSERILFVDDEEALVEMGEDILAEIGYEVISRMSSREALSLLKEDPSRFDLVITDQTMPEMTGVELAKEILALKPDMPIIMCTGFSYVVDADKARAAGIKAFAMKPLTKKEIAKTIRKVLDG
jgi:PAS domain S-box-containing protein